MNTVLRMMLLVAVTGTTLVAEEVSFDGTWSGKLGEAKGLRLIFHLEEDSDGVLKAKVDSPDQGATGIAVSRAAHEGKKWSFHVDSAHGVFRKAWRTIKA